MVRRLSVILAADVVGFSALMATDETGTVAMLGRFRKAVLDPLLGAHGGRIVKLMGDGLLAEFTSVAQAIEFAFGFQQASGGFEDGRLRLRIGVNLGDVIAQDADIYGDGVNVAARLEPLAEPGGICISASVHDSLLGEPKARFRDGGAQQLKNIPRPVHVWHWRPDAAPLPSPLPAGGGGSDFKSGKPSIAVLAFDNMSHDPEQEYFSDGIAEDLITALSHFRDFFVIARNTSFTYKGRSLDCARVCRDLGVQYVVEGSVRRAGNRVRVTAQLIEGATNAHLWAGRFDRDLDDIFAVQDEITGAIVAAVAPETIEAELKRSRAKPIKDLSVWQKVLRARWYLGKFTPADNATARTLLSEVIEIAPRLPEVHSARAHCDLMDMLHLWRTDIMATIASARKHAWRAVELDDGNAEAQSILGLSMFFAREFDDGTAHLDRALQLNPNLATAYGIRTASLGINHEYGAAQTSLGRALALSPRDPLRAFWLAGLGIGAYIAGEYEDCVRITREGLRDHPGYASLMRQEAAALAMLGRSEEAAALMARLLARMPELTVEKVRHMVPIRYRDDHERWLEGLRRAGLPE